METQVTHIADKAFDYVVVGGGTTGLCLASRLSEDPQVTVLVLEAGPLHLKDPLIDIPAGFPKQMGDPKYDWVFKTVPQKSVDDKSIVWTRGKGLGGSSNINYLAWTRPSKEDIDAWERLGNPGWNWENFLHYLKKCEGLHTPSQEILTREELNLDPRWFGNEGPVSVSFPDPSSGVETILRETFKARGVPILQDPVNGKSAGTWCGTSSVDARTRTRSSAVTAYYLPNSGRSNLHVLTGAYVNRLLIEGGQDSKPVIATGVEFRHDDNVYKVHAKREVVLCAGSLKSPQVLELSGIGDSAILKPLGIDVKLHLPGVGKNVQDHIRHIGISFELPKDSKVLTWDTLKNPIEREKHAKLYSEKREGLMALTVSGFSFVPVQIFSDKADAIVKRQLERVLKSQGHYPAALLEQYHIQAERLKNPGLHECEIIAEPMFGGFNNPPEDGKKYISFLVALTSPWSRGTLHVQSKDPLVQPAIDPHYLEEDIDLELFTEAYKFARSIGQCEPFKSLIVKEANPGPGVTSDNDIREHIKQGLNSIYHTTGTLSMLPLEKEGVVDPSLRVWGTKNIRVADISIIPLQIGTHTQATAYAIAEKAADLIRGRI